MIDKGSNQQHSLLEDALALLTATPLVALGITFYSQAELLTGSTAGLAFLIKYLTEWGFGPVFFMLNLPFYLVSLLELRLATSVPVSLVMLIPTLALDAVL